MLRRGSGVRAVGRVVHDLVDGLYTGPLTLYSGNDALAVVPSVLLMAVSSVLLALQVAFEDEPSGDLEPLTG